MAWIELHQSLWTHRKTYKLAAELQILPVYAAGHMAQFWCWALDNVPDGDLSEINPQMVAIAAGWPGDPETFYHAAFDAGFFEKSDCGDSSIIHGWYDYAGRLLEQREAQAEYRQRQNALYNDLRLTKAVRQRDGDVCQYCGKTVAWNDRRGVDGGTYDHVDPNGNNNLENIVVACRSCNSKKGKRTPEEARMKLITGSYTVDNRQNNGENTADKPIVFSTNTVPNRTQPNLTNQTNNTSSTKTKKPSQLDDYTADFEEFWARYPRHVAKREAYAKWQARIKEGAIPSVLIAAAGHYAMDCVQRDTEEKYIKHPATFLGPSKHYEDYLHPPEPPKGKIPKGIISLQDWVNDRDKE